MPLTSILAALATSDDTVYVLSRDRRIVQTNEGWARFARANGGGDALARASGTVLDDVLPPPLRERYVAALERAFVTGERWEHDYECSSPELLRRYRMVAYPISSEHLVCIHSLLVEHPHEREASAASASTYAVNGLITTCSYCRRIANPSGTARWDWVPAFVAEPPPNLSHGLCEACFALYYGALDE